MLTHSRPEPGTWQVDLTHVPSVYPTSNPAFFGKWAVDLYPESIPTIAPFETERAAHDWLADTFGEGAHRRWFPSLYEESYQTCAHCTGWRPVAAFRRGYCEPCYRVLRMAEVERAFQWEGLLRQSMGRQHP